MASVAANTAKPSSSVKLVLLGEAAVGKVSSSVAKQAEKGQEHLLTGQSVIARAPVCQQRLSREQGAYNWRYT